MPRLLDMAYDRFPGIPEFVKEYIREQNLGENDGVCGQTLIRLCGDEFCDELERENGELWNRAKDDIVASIKRMVSKGTLTFLRRDDIVFFRLAQEQLTEDNHGESTIIVEQREKDAEEAETSLLEEDQAEADRHTAGYVEMTRGARPFVPPPAEEDISTPSRKRRRVNEIPASDISSWDSISPVQHPNSTPRRRPRPPSSPLSGSRRRSAPTQSFSPMKPRDTREFRADERLRHTLFKQEKKDTSPPWLIQGLNDLRSKYPDDTFESENGKINCLDCGREFKTSSNHNVSNFENHLKSKGHRVIVTKKLEWDSTYQQFLPPKKMIHMDFSYPQAPFMVFAHKRQQTLAESRNLYLSALEDDSHMKSIRLSMVESRVQAADKKLVEQCERLGKVLETSDRTNKETKEKFNRLSDVLKSTEEKCEIQVREVVERVDSSESKNSELLKDMKEQIIGFEDKCDSRISETNTRLARLNQRTLDQLDNITDRLTNSERESKDKLEQIQLLVDRNKIQDEEISKLQSQAQGHSNDVENLRSHSQQLAAQIKELEQANKYQVEEIHDLQSQSQLHTEELQRQRESDLSFRKTITDQMQGHFEQTERRINKLTTETQDRTESMEQQMLSRISSIEEHFARKMLSLEKKSAEQREDLERFQALMPLIFEDGKELREYIEELEKRIVEREAIPPSPRKVRRDVKRTSVAP